MKSKIRQINLSRLILRYSIAAIVTSLLMGTAFYINDRIRIKNDPSYRFTHIQMSWADGCGISLSMILIPILLFAVVKQLFFKANSNYWLNAFVFVLVIFLFFILI